MEGMPTEGLLQIVLIFIVAVSGIVSMLNKGKKEAKKPQQPKASAWDELDESVEKRFEEFIGKHDDKPDVPYVTHQPVPMQPVMVMQPVPDMHIEGMPAEPVVAPAPKPAAQKELKPMEPVRKVEHTARSRILPKNINADTLRSAVVMSEVLGKPVALKKAARR